MARIKFPNPRPAVGAPFGEKTGYPDWNDCDYEGQNNGNGVNDRMRWVTNPLGPDVAVAKMWVEEGDWADKFGGCRAECWQEPHSLNGLRVGQRAFCAWSVFLPAGFRTTSSWGLVWQIHTPVGSAAETPLLALDTTGGKLSFRGVGDVPGGYNKGRWQTFAADIVMGVGNGSFQAWCAVDAKPDVTKPPTLQRVNYTTHPGDGDGVQWPKLGVYRDPAGGSATFPTEAFYGGYGLSTSSMSEALADAQFDAILATPPPPQDSLPLTVLAVGASYTLVGWQPAAGCIGYRFRTDRGKWSHTWDPLFRRDTSFPACNTRFPKTYSRIEVEALGVLAKGDLP